MTRDEAINQLNKVSRAMLLLEDRLINHDDVHYLSLDSHPEVIKLQGEIDCLEQIIRG